MAAILFIIYVIAGYWAVNQTVYANKVLIGTLTNIFFRKLTYAIFVGWILIPVAIFKSRISK